MNMHWITSLTNGLADLTKQNTLLAVGLIAVLLAMLRLATTSRDQTMEWIQENVQVVLSVVVVVFLIIRPFLFQAFYIPSSSMEPTLMGPPGSDDSNFHTVNGAGDRLLVNKLIYRVGNPHRLDIAVFHAPKQASREEKEFIKRVIGLPNDTVEVVPPRLLADNRALMVLSSEGYYNTTISLPEKAVPRVDSSGRTAEVPTSDANPLRVIAEPNPQVSVLPGSVEVDGKVELQTSGPFEQIEETRSPMELGGDSSINAEIFKITGYPRLVVVTGRKLAYDPGHVLVNGVQYAEPYIKEAPRYAMAPKKLGPDEYFMMGDNRNNSNDSHAWGALKRERFIGRAEILFWPPRRFRIFHWWLILFLIGSFIVYQFLQRLLIPR